MRVLVTGVAGFIGSHVAETLLQQGDEVFGLDDLSGGRRENVPAGVQFVHADVCEDLESLMRQAKPQAVLHLAAYAAEGLSHHIPSFNYQNNLVATANVLAAAYRHQVEHFLFASSIAAYGHPPSDRAFTEDTPCRPCDPYGIAKLACEQHISSFYEYYGGPKFTIFRPHNVFGPKQNISDPYRNVVGIFFRCVLQGKSLPVFGDGTQTRDFSYVDVVSKCMVQSLRNASACNEVFNVGGGESLSVGTLAEMVLKVAGSTAEVEHLPARNEVLHAHADHAKARRIFPEAFEEALSVEEGLQKTWDFVSSHPIPPVTPCPAPVELWERLPPRWKESLREEDDGES